MKMTVKSTAILVPAIFAAGILAASVLGFWKTTSTKVPVAIKDGEFAGLPNPSDIRGSYTWDDVAKAFQFDVALVLEAFGATDSTQKVNTLEALYGEAGLPEGVEIGTDSVRLFVSLLTGLPHSPEEGTVLPASAIAVLRENGKADQAAIDAAAARAFPPGAGAPAAVTKPAEAPVETTAPIANTATAVTAAAPVATAAPAAVPASETATTGKNAGTTDASTDHTQTVGTVTGKTTFGELKSWGLPEEKILKATGGERGPDSAAVRDWAATKGLSFPEIKAALQAALAEK